MRYLLIALVLVVNFTAFAEEAEDLSNIEGRLNATTGDANPNDIATPVLVKSADGKETHGGFISVTPTPQRPDALTILRQELLRQEMQAQEKAKRDGVFLSTTKRFTPESITFFIAIGAVTFNSMWIKSHGDPLAMQRHILSLKDPIAHISFYAFMQSQGFYTNFHTGRAKFHAMDASTKQQMMRRLSYQGMAIGSFASSVVGDLGQSVKMCVDKWIKGKKDEQSLASCNQAWQQWTLRNKFSQYFPQIISMWAAQAATEFVEHSASRGFTKLTSAAWMKKILTRDFLVRAAYKVTAADVVTTFVGGGWITKSIKFAGKLTRFGGFVAVDHVISHYTYRPINNILKPLLFDFDALAINRLWTEADAGSWNASKISNPKNLEKFEKEIENYGQQMQQWRDHLNSDAETDLAGWLEMTKKILNQADYAYKYYQAFADTLFETLSIGHQIHSRELAPSAATIISRYPMRTLPFYGVKPGPYVPVGGQLTDLYLLNPNELQQRQKEHVLAIGQKYKNAATAITKAQDKASMAKIINKLNSGDTMRMASGLNDMNQDIGIYDLQMRQEHPYSNFSIQYISALKKIKSELGNPAPVVYDFAGFSQAFTAYSPNFMLAELADYSRWSTSQKYKFNKDADLMMYKLICGKPRAELKKYRLAGVNFFNPQYEPPTLLNPNTNTARFCSSLRTTYDLYSTPIGNVKLKDFLLKNLNYNAIGDFRGQRPDRVFEKWWVRNAKDPLAQDFRNYDNEFKKVFQLASDNFFNKRGLFKKVVDVLNQSLYLPKSLQATLKAETSLYLQILNRTLMAGTVATPNPSNTPMPGTTPSFLSQASSTLQRNSTIISALTNSLQSNYFNYLEYSTKNGTQTQFHSMYKTTPRQITELNSLFNSYYNFISASNLNFQQYIAHSKRMDTAINDILVMHGLMRVKSGPSMDADIEDFSAAPAASGNENSPKEYEDIPVANPTYKQRMAVAAIKGLRLVESEIRRFIRMKIALSESLVADNNEILAEWSNASGRRNSQGFNPYGGN